MTRICILVVAVGLAGCAGGDPGGVAPASDRRPDGGGGDTAVDGIDAAGASLPEPAVTEPEVTPRLDSGVIPPSSPAPTEESDAGAADPSDPNVAPPAPPSATDAAATMPAPGPAPDARAPPALDTRPVDMDTPASGAAAFFKTEQVHRIDITIDPAMWAAYLADHRFYGLRTEKRWFAADFTIDGVVLKNVAFHTFGFGSRIQQKEKPNLSIDINRNVPGQRLRGLTRMRIKNNGQDITGLRQALVYEAMREAKLMAPRSTYTKLFVNGEDYGLYFVEEAYTKNFVQEHTGNDDGPAYEADGCVGLVMPPDGCGNIVGSYVRDFNPMVGMGEDLAALCTAVNVPAAEFMSKAAPVIDLREWVDQIAIDTALAGDQDGFSVAGANYRLYRDTATGKMRLTILGADDTFIEYKVHHPDPLRPIPKPGCTDEFNPQYRDIIIDKLTGTPEGLAYYKDAVRRLRTGVMAADKIKARVDALWAIVGPHVKVDKRNVQYDDPDERKEAIKKYVDLRWPLLEKAGF